MENLFYDILIVVWTINCIISGPSFTYCSLCIIGGTLGTSLPQQELCWNAVEVIKLTCLWR